ncbi:hypothetical protein [Natrarchaeobaculum sulfurireducens]|uniref:DUF2971 domain-containing protein n=1 Tax=Natrarchaeobaculum sulfurireducens TaxID=2044521 RepID=A0A346PS06_9EURY|nr:hypothetical protein [Natrarchaeobaculum sulfurireducens]AXR82301.1 hypothetical protein AArcMg_2305 [Natrarchaeobaculum sulfurireducens]
MEEHTERIKDHDYIDGPEFYDDPDPVDASSFESKVWQPDDIGNDENKTIWRYLDLSQLYIILEKEYLWFSHIRNFDDPYEGVYSDKTAEQIAEMYVDLFDYPEETAIKKAKMGNLSAYVNCWTNQKNQSVALWEQYVEGDKGVAIKTTSDNLKNAIVDNRQGIDLWQFIFGKINYVDYEKPMPQSDSAPVYHKRNSFGYEEEYRAAVFNYAQLATDGAPKITQGGFEWPYEPGLKIDIDPTVLIDELYVSPTADSYFIEAVESIVTEYIDVEVKQSHLFDDPLE